MNSERKAEIRRYFSGKNFGDGIRPLPYTDDTDEQSGVFTIVDAEEIEILCSWGQTARDADTPDHDTVTLLADAPSLLLEVLDALDKAEIRIAELEAGQMVLVQS